jgi:hypothetical protein
MLWLFLSQYQSFMKGIMFIEDMFLMVLAGVKSETRRIATADVHHKLVNFNIDNEAIFENLQTGELFGLKPKYKPNEIVYLKEPYQSNYHLVQKDILYELKQEDIVYKYFNPPSKSQMLDEIWKNKMFMPEKYSRFKIQIISVDIQELNNISNQSAINEGIAELLQSSMQLSMNGRLFRDYSIKKERFMNGLKAVKSYETLWNSINKDVPFKSNPYVWVYSFRVFN